MKTISLGIGSIIEKDKIFHIVKSRPFFSFVLFADILFPGKKMQSSVKYIGLYFLKN